MAKLNEIEDMSCLEIAQEIAGRFGKEATKSRFEGYYEFKTGKCLIVIGKHRYYPEVHGGAWHISLDFRYKDGGYSAPCDSFEEAPAEDRGKQISIFDLIGE